MVVMQSRPFKKSPIELDPGLLSPKNIFDLLPEDHDCYVYHDIFEQLDTQDIERTYSMIGQNAYHPRLLVSILIYAYSHGIFSSREIERRCHQDLAFLYISQMNCPNFRVLSDFRKDHLDFFHDCFKQTVKLSLELKLASLGHISLDGSKFKANSSKHKAMSYKRLKEQEATLTEEIEELITKAARCDEEEDSAYKENTGYEIPEDLTYKQQRLAKIHAAKNALELREESEHPGKDIEEKKQISFADHDARIMGKKGDFDYRYNGQISVDRDNQIIVGQHVSQHANDTQEVEPSLDALKEATNGLLPKRMSADNGYMSGENLHALEGSGIECYIATDKGEKRAKIPLDDSNRKLVKADFDYDEEADQFGCPGGQVLPLRRETHDGKKIYQGDADICATCPYKSRCCQSTKGEARTITTDDKEPLRQQMRMKMERQEAQEIYKERKVIVEPVFGQIKNSGFRGFSVRGQEKTAGEFSLVCAVHNIKKIAKAIMTGRVRSESGHLVVNQA
jgi:transposase